MIMYPALYFSSISRRCVLWWAAFSLDVESISAVGEAAHILIPVPVGGPSDVTLALAPKTVANRA